MIALSPPLLLVTANAFVGLGEDRAAAAHGSRGALVDCFIREVTGAGGGAGAWDAAFVHHVGFWSHFDPREERSWWPLPLLTDLKQLASFARERSVLRHTPVAGDLFLLKSPATDEFVRTGIVAEVQHAVEMEDGTPCYECHTIEGDSDQNLALGGGTTLRHWRRLSAARGDRFVRWSALDMRLERAGPIEEAVELDVARRSA